MTTTTATITQEMTITQEIEARLRALDYAGLARLYRADALFDASVPQWRYQLKGREAITEKLAEEAATMGPQARVTDWRVTPIDDGIVVQMEVSFTDGGEECLWREVDLFHTDGEFITEHVNYCTGIWDAATIARQAVEAPMVTR